MKSGSDARNDIKAPLDLPPPQEWTPSGSNDLNDIQTASLLNFGTPLKSIFSMFQMISSKKKNFLFWYKKNFWSLRGVIEG